MRKALFSHDDGTPNSLLLGIFDASSTPASRLAKGRAALAAGARIDAPLFDDGTTMLMSACECGYTDRLELLIELGADPNARRSDGGAPLWCACAEHGQHQAAMVILLGHGARIEGAGPGGLDALDELLRRRASGAPDLFGSIDERIAILEAGKLAQLAGGALPARAPPRL